MLHEVRILIPFVVLSGALMFGCSSKEGEASSAESSSPTGSASRAKADLPEMPTGWRVTSDATFQPADIRPISERLGAEVVALRNTVYSVNGKSVKLNVIVAADETGADKIMASLRGMKGEEALVRQGLTMYEFVGPNDVLPEIRAGKAHLLSRD